MNRSTPITPSRARAVASGPDCRRTALWLVGGLVLVGGTIVCAWARANHPALARLAVGMSLASVALAAAVGVKLWPVLLLPFLLRTFWGRWRTLAAAALVLMLLLGAMGVRYASAFGRGSDSGLLTYARIWGGRAGAYQLFDELGWWFRSRLSLDVDGRYVGRGLMMLVLLPAVLWLGLRRAQGPAILCRRMGLVILLTLLLGPVLWPWYYLPVIPLAVVAAPRLGLLAWTALLPLCYLESKQLSAVHLTWLVHVPVWTLLVIECIWPRIRRRLQREGGECLKD